MTVNSRFRRALERPGPLVLDGGLATHLQAMGNDLRGVLWSAALLERNPDAIVAAHRAYLEAGADCIISASYQASRMGFTKLGRSAGEADRLIARSVELALRARQEYLAGHPAAGFEPLVAASVGPYGAALADGSEYSGAYSVSRDELRDFHLPRLTVLDESGADILAVETIPDMVEAEVLCELLRDTNTPAWVSFSCRDESAISDGTPLAEAAALYADHPTVLAVGINCTPPQLIPALIRELRRAVPGKAIVVYPNSGETYNVTDKSWSGRACDLDKEFAVVSWHRAGAKLIGGCCRTGPDDIRAIRRRLQTDRNQ
ncbi:MAG: homocysteine S-methyltransferase [Gammaproteobacteria bacterium]|nr:homocysteine S-methyltransferase [Gammaproteobacteria bacterium]MDH5309852.1 homocysteine S-methyltransferase [Gammaproteobacteria bacterium]